MRALCGRAIAVFALAVLAAGCGRGSAAQARLPHVVMVVVDTLRVDRLGAYGNQRGLTPFLDSLAKRANVVERDYAQAPWTNPSVASLFTSRYLSQHGVADFGSVLGADETTLTEVLHAAGYATAGFSANGLISERAGFGQGFDQYSAFMLLDGRSRFERASKRAEEINAVALRWLDRIKRDRSVFLYVQYMEPHAPFAPPLAMLDKLRRPGEPWIDVDVTNQAFIGSRLAMPAPTVLGDIRDVYDAEVLAVDEGIKDLMAALAKRGIDDPLLIVTADHGEELADHGQLGHGQTLYGEVLHVPLIIRTPGQTEGRVIKRLVSSIDIGPTVLDELGLAIPERFEGVSFARDLTARDLGTRIRRLGARLFDERPEPAAFSQLVPLAGSDLTKEWPERAVVVGDRKMIAWSGGRRDFYALADDPQEQRPDALSGMERDRLTAALDQIGGRVLRDRTAAEQQTIDPKTRDALRALGYTH